MTLNAVQRMTRALEAHQAGRLSDLELHGVTLGAIREFAAVQEAERVARREQGSWADLSGSLPAPGPSEAALDAFEASIGLRSTPGRPAALSGPAPASGDAGGISSEDAWAAFERSLNL